MNIIEAAEQLKQGKAIQLPRWGNASIQAAQLETGEYKLYVNGDLSTEMIVLLEESFRVKSDT